MAEPIKIGGQWLDPMTGQPVAGPTTDADIVQRLMQGLPVAPEDLARLQLPTDYNAARQMVMANNEASGKESGLLGAMSGVMESPLAPLLLGGAFLGMGGAFSGLGGSAGGDLINIDPSSLGLSNVDNFGGLTQLASDASGLEAGTAAADFGMGEFAGYPGGWESGAANAAPGVASTGVDAFGGLPWGNAAAGNPGSGSGFLGGVGDFLKGVTPGQWLGVGGQLLGSGLGYLGATKAAGAQEKAAGDAQGLAKYMYDQNRADLAPWREAGVGALGNLVNLTTPGKQLDTAMLDPGYAFRQAEGEKGINRGAAARGMWDSGATMKALNRFNQDYATGEFSNVYNRNANLAGLGQVGTTAGVAAGQNYANNAGNLMTQAGNARASGYVGGANALSGGLSSLINNYNQQTSLDKVLKAYGLG